MFKATIILTYLSPYMWYMIAGKSHRMNDVIKFKPLKIAKENRAQEVKVLVAKLRDLYLIHRMHMVEGED